MSGLDLASLGIPSDTQYLEEYCANTGLGDVNTWNFYLSFAFFRIAAILQGVYKRSLQSKTILTTSSLCFISLFPDQASGENAAEAGKAAKFFADMSWKFARRQDRDPVQERAPVLGPMAVTVDSLGSKARRYHTEVTEFVREEILPVEQELRDHTMSDDWATSQKIEELKRKAKSAGLWNLFVPHETDPEMKYGKGLTNLEYAHVCEVTIPLMMKMHDNGGLR